MGRKTKLTCQSRFVNIVIRKNKEIPISTLKQYCIENFEKYAFIEHKNHIDISTGEIDGVHYHIVGDFIKSKIPFSTRLNTIVDYFHFDNSNGIEIEKYISFEGSLQYLTHKNQPEKTQEDKSKIIHNLSKEDFEILYNCEIGNVITFDTLFTSCLTAHNIVDVIRDIGIGNYRLWRVVIWDIWQTMNDKTDYCKSTKGVLNHNDKGDLVK